MFSGREIKSLQQLIAIKNKRQILSTLSPTDVTTMRVAQIEPTQENFDIVVEEGNIPLMQDWVGRYGFYIDPISVVRANKGSMLQYFDVGYDYSGEYGFDPVLEEVAKVKNMYYLHKFGSSLSKIIPSEFAKFGWLDGIGYLVELLPRTYDYDVLSQAIISAIIFEHWETVRFLMYLLTPTQLISFKQDIINNVWTVNNGKQELIDIMNDIN